MQAIWGKDYDDRTDKCFDRPLCPNCDAPIIISENGVYKCVSCKNPVDVVDEDMLKWLVARAETKIEMLDCPKLEFEGHSIGCGGKSCVETHYRRNDATLEWQVSYGKCQKCGMQFIV